MCQCPEFAVDINFLFVRIKLLIVFLNKRYDSIQENSNYTQNYNRHHHCGKLEEVCRHNDTV